MRAVLFQMLFPIVLSGCGEALMKDPAASMDPQQEQDRPVGGSCEDCDLMFEGMPPIEQIPSTAVLASANEPGERMELSGTAFKIDGTTPAAGVVVYLYHTDATGRYTPEPGQKEGRRHGHLRGWVRTDPNGHFQVKSIRPASYPDSRIPQHIHMLVKEPGLTRYWIDDVWFDDDPFVTKEELARTEQRGGDRLTHLDRTTNGWSGQYTIILGKNIPGYR